MNTIDFPDRGLDSAQLDRLIDGTLEPAERAALLRRLEAQPDGWRRCALGFLESQAWREALRPLAEPAHTSTPTIVSPTTPAQRPAVVAAFGRPLALAASLAAAFGLGRALTPSPSTPTQPVAPIAANPPLAPEAHPPAPAPSVVPPPINEAPLLADAALPAASDLPAPRLEPDSAVDQPLATIPAELRRRLAAEGFRIEPRGGYGSIRTADGRVVRVPYHGVQARFVGNRTY